MIIHRFFILRIALFVALLNVHTVGVAQEKMLNLNKLEREAWFTDLGLGMFIHWSVDVQYGYNISHSLRLASNDYITRYFSELPKTFNPDEFAPDDWAKLAKMTGMKYVVFTAKHHNGFCMWDTPSTDFNIMHTPFNRDVVKEVVEAFRKEGIAIGIYFSPDDFWFLHQQGNPITRNHPTAKASNNEELNQYAKKQLKELLTKYGKIDILFLDGNEQFGKTELAKVAWEINPEIVVTRGAMETPEQKLPDTPIPSPWESCITVTDSWSYRPTNEAYKTASEVIMTWVEIKAKGGNLLLNVGPNAKGKIPERQAATLNEVGAWWFINHELFENTKPFDKVKTRSGYYLLQSKDEKDLYVVVPGKVQRNAWQTAYLESMQISKTAKVSLLGQGDYTSESRLEKSEPMCVENVGNSAVIKYIFLHNLYNKYRVENRWNNPIVLKISNFNE